MSRQGVVTVGDAALRWYICDSDERLVHRFFKKPTLTRENSRAMFN